MHAIVQNPRVWENNETETFESQPYWLSPQRRAICREGGKTRAIKKQQLTHSHGTPTPTPNPRCKNPHNNQSHQKTTTDPTHIASLRLHQNHAARIHTIENPGSRNSGGSVMFVQYVQFEVFPYRLSQGNCGLPSACRKEAKAQLPLPLGGPYRLGGTTLASRLAASRNYKHPWGFPLSGGNSPLANNNPHRIL